MKIAWLSLLLLALALAAAIAFRLGLDRALEPGSVRTQVSQATANLLDAKAGFSPLKWGGLSILARSFLAQSPDGEFEVRGAGIKMPLSLAQLWRREWKIDKVSAARLQIAFAGAHLPAADGSQSPELFSPVVDAQSVREIVSPRTDLFFDVGTLRDASTRIFAGTIDADGGMFQIANWPGAQVRRLTLLRNKTSLRLREAWLTFGGASLLQISGNLRPNLDVDLTFAHCPIATFLGSSIDGEFDGGAHLRNQPNESVRAAGKITVRDAIVRQIAALQRAADFCGRADLAHLKIDNVTADFESDGNAILVKNFVLDAKPLLILRGEFALRGERIDGEFELGVAPDLAAKFPGARANIFQREADGYVWTQFAISGERNNLHDNLRPRLVRAARDHHVDEKQIDALEDL